MCADLRNHHDDRLYTRARRESGSSDIGPIFKTIGGCGHVLREIIFAVTAIKTDAICTHDVVERR